MPAEEMLKLVMSWAGEDSHRGRLVRAFQSNMGNDARLQADRLALLGVHAKRQALRKAGLSLD
ncbi:hypothetical protein ACIHFE_12930 [Streptomyces sp. NPDC052396]|uniref:hypothetical protein n=1 Tax=Streptomyces sp. NPDC052396 TaxID=3365689 RepID=UPI0037D35DD5